MNGINLNQMLEMKNVYMNFKKSIITIKQGNFLCNVYEATVIMLDTAICSFKRA